MLISVLLLLTLSRVVLGQRYPGGDEIRNVQLTIESATLPEADRKEITRRFHNQTYETVAELSERLRDALQVLGYFKASVGDPKVSFVSEKRGVRIADIRVSVEEGLRYRLGQITFTGGTVFPTERLRQAIPMETGELFNTEKMRQGIKNLHDLYASYLNFTPVPDTTIDDLRGTVDVTFDLDEGKPFRFGPLVLDGPEPHPGAGKALLESWKTLQGQPYNPERLQQWFVDNQSSLPPNPERLMEISQDNTAGIAIVRLWLP